MQGEKPYVAARYCSLFGWGRPPVPWDIADTINMTVRQSGARSVGVTGSISPSVITAIGYDNPIPINTFANRSLWDEGTALAYVLDDSPGMDETVPWPSKYLPVSAFKLWEGATPFFDSEIIFSDLPFSHPAVGLEVEYLTKEYPVVMMGFLEDHAGPDDLLAWCKQRQYSYAEQTAPIYNTEYGKQLKYRLVVAKLA